MTRFGSCLLVLLLSVIALGIVGCGSSRKLQSVGLTPASADAQNFPNGQVSFTATGTFSKPPSPAQLSSKDVLPELHRNSHHPCRNGLVIYGES